MWKKQPRFNIEATLRSLAHRLDNIEASISYLTHMEKRTMSALDDLNAAIAALGTTVASAVAAIETELAVIANAPANDTAAIAAAAAAISGITKTLGDEVAKAVPPAPAPVPTPVVEPVPAPVVEPAPAPAAPAPDAPAAS